MNHLITLSAAIVAFGLSAPALSGQSTAAGHVPEDGCSLTSAGSASVARCLLTPNRQHLASVRERARRGDPGLEAALAGLEADAAKAMALAPMSVMDKTIAPPSGDRHDYMSQAPYWWPDPSKPDGKPYIRRDGERNPEIDRITDHDNLGRLTGAVATLGLAFHLTGRQDY